ncbi:uncharacterized protein PAC_00842 [Phialocephala subalpina]|uniref:PSI domain-containing protein n=1 Tax=Phialocephala subalpina TaxID=576137 RepID=A0A1L7WDW3_9HELO|nr:uncharacterized protein PAC_00842 [Phialocephala subalpina]
MWFRLRCRDQSSGLEKRTLKTDLGVETAIGEWKARNGLVDIGEDGITFDEDSKVGKGGVQEQRNRTEAYDDMLRICWSKQDCSSCLNTGWMRADDGGASVGCSWCPGSQTCIPNPTHPPLFAPFHNPNICPLWYERWELRTKPLGCYVSTITFLSVIVAVISTLLVVSILVAIGFGIRKCVLWNREERNRGWWRFWRWRVGLRDARGRKRGARGRTNGVVEDGERASLLGDGENGG